MAKAPSSQKSPRKPAVRGKRDTKRAKSSVRPDSELPVGKWVTAARGKPAKRGLEKAYLEIAGKLEESQAELKKTSRLLRKEIKHSEKIESELQFSKARLQSLTTFADHHIFVLDKEGRYLFSNQKAGLSVSGELLSYVGRHQREFHAPKVAETYDAQIKSVLQTGKAVDFEHFALEKDGLHQHLDTLYPIAEGGRIVALGGICRDITRQKAVQEKLLKSEERFKRMFELGLTGMAIISVDKVWQDVNDRLCEILGYPREELTLKTWAQITHPDDLAAEAAQFERVLAGEIDSYHVEKRFIRKDGRNINAETSVACLRRLDGAVHYFVAFVQDNTDRKLAQDALQEAKNNLEAIFNATQHAVLLMDTVGVVISANVELSRRLGLRVEEIVGKPIFDFLPLEIANRRRRYTEAVVRTRKPIAFEDAREDRIFSITVYPIPSVPMKVRHRPLAKLV